MESQIGELRERMAHLDDLGVGIEQPQRGLGENTLDRNHGGGSPPCRNGDLGTVEVGQCFQVGGVLDIRHQGQDGVVPVRPRKFHLHPEILGQLGRDVDLKADQLAVRIAGRPGFEQADADLRIPRSWISSKALL